MATALVIDDVQAFRLLVTSLLQRRCGVTVVGEADNGALAVEFYKKLWPELVTLDLNLPDQDGLVVLRNLLRLDRDARVVVISSEDDIVVHTAALAAGAKAVVGKPLKGQELAEAVRLALEEPRHRPASFDADVRSILVIDDQPDMAAIAAQAAALAECQVGGHVPNVAAARTFLASQQADLVVFELGAGDRPEVNLRWLAEVSKLQVMPAVIAVTRHAERAVVELAARNGVKAYLIKPVTPAQLAEALKRAL